MSKISFKFPRGQWVNAMLADGPDHVKNIWVSEKDYVFMHHKNKWINSNPQRVKKFWQWNYWWSTVFAKPERCLSATLYAEHYFENVAEIFLIPELMCHYLPPGLCFNIKTVFPWMVILSIKIRHWWDHLIFIMRIPILVWWCLYIEMDPRFTLVGGDKWPLPTEIFL